MKVVMSGALCDLPVVGSWDFGGFAYGLEPLVLPPAGAPDAVEDDTAGIASVDAYAEIFGRLRKLAERDVPTPDVGPCDAPDELFWFRWITGHQVCFVVWRLIGQLLEDVKQGRRAPEEILGPVCRYMDTYSAMLLYTGSCPRDIYSVLIRPSMRLRHRAFSGSWAPDYWPIRDLFRRPRLSSIWTADADELLDALALLHLVHDGVGARLVTDRKSLLREAAVRGPNHRLAGMIYDSYFMTLRAPVPRHEVVAQLLRRLVAIAQDIVANGLDAPDDDDERPTELQAAEVIKCGNSLIDNMVSVARYACELAGEQTSPLRSTVASSAAEV
jgi:L-tyrosine peroxygenase